MISMVTPRLCLLLLKCSLQQDNHSHARSLSDLTCTATKQCDSGREFRFMVGTTLPFRVSNDFYANIKITDIIFLEQRQPSNCRCR